MLGRLRMSLDQCQAAYLKLSQRIFNPKRHTLNTVGKAKDFFLADGKFDHKELEDAIKDIIHEDCKLLPETLLQDPDPRSRVFVCAMRTGNSEAAILRSYENDEPELLYDECTIWEACRATSAATTFFDPIKIGPFDQEFADAGVIYNNPIELLHREASAMWPDQMENACIISVGTGSAPGRRFQGNIKNIVEAMKSIVTQTERTANDFFLAHQGMVSDKRLFRFNVYHGLADVGLEEWKEKARIADSTQTYLMNGETRVKVKQCIEKMSEMGPRDASGQSSWDDSSPSQSH
jgi:predicted acylesterase/phospholipase RssA